MRAMTARPEDMRERAEFYAATLARIGYSGPRMLALFADPTRVQAHAALRALGEPAIRGIIVRALTRASSPPAAASWDQAP
jgi:hypothetical protein